MAVETNATRIRRPAWTAWFPGLVLARVVARRAMRGAVLWGVVFGLVTWLEVGSFAQEYPTAADRVRAAEIFGANVGTQALFGPTRDIGTVAGYVAFHMIGVLGLIAAVWGLLAGTRLLRGEEEAGRWELLLTGHTTRRRATADGLVGLGLGLLALWTVTAGLTVAAGRSPDAGFTVSASLFASVAVGATAAMFLAVGALCSQLAATRRQAAGLAAGIFGVAYLIRVVAYSADAVRWLRWVSPLGWVDELRPLTASRPLALVPIVGLIAVLATLTIVLAGRRDLGASMLPRNDSAAPRTWLLGGPLGLASRLGLRTALGWIGGLAAGGLVLGLITKSSEDAWGNQTGGIVGRLGGATGGASYLGITFLLVAILVGAAAAGQVGATRDEEAEGYLDHLLARPLARFPWLAGRFAVSAAVLATAGVVTGIFAWVGGAVTGADQSLATMLAAGANVVPVGIFVLGVGTLIHGVVPRFAVAATYGLVAWSFLVEVIGATLGASRWLLDTSVLHHIARAPAANVRWDGVAVLIMLGVAAAAMGTWRFARRDLTGA